VLTRGRDGFDWKEVAAKLQVGDRTLRDTFWNEIWHADSIEEGHSEKQNVIQKPQDEHPVNPPDSAPSR